MIWSPGLVTHPPPCLRCKGTEQGGSLSPELPIVLMQLVSALA